MRKSIISVIVIISVVMGASSVFAGQLDAKTEQALIGAIQDEYKARALYQKVLDKFGEDVRPFSNIIKAEGQHIEELKPLFEQYEVAIPEDEWDEKVPEFASVQDACEAGVTAEIENAGMYDEFFAFVKEQDIIDVFTRLRDASQEKHLPAFQRCAENGGNGRGRGGNGNGNGNGNDNDNDNGKGQGKTK